MPKQPQFERSSCPIAVTLDIIGDKWTLIVVRDLLRGVTRYSDFMKSPEQIRTNILAERLKRLESHCLIKKTQYQDHPPRYEYHLTEMGLSLAPVIREICLWGNEFFPGTLVPSEKLMFRQN